MTNTTISHPEEARSVVSHARLVAAIEQRDFELYYQPVVDLRTGQLRGLEALVRLPHPSRGVIAAAEFIPLAEEVGVIRQLDDWVIAQACEQLAAWQSTGLMRPGLDLAVNVSGSEADGSSLGQRFAQALASSGADPVGLVVEITESELSGPHESTQSVEALHDLGLRVALDDFGTGHATFSRLRSLDFDLVKIDRLVMSLITSNLTQGFIRILVEKCREDGAVVIAEGVESAEQASLASDLGCELAQGYYWSAAVPASQAEQLLLEATPASPPRNHSMRLQAKS